jgi:hypothetical protein
MVDEHELTLSSLAQQYRPPRRQQILKLSLKYLVVVIALFGCASIDRTGASKFYPDTNDPSGNTWRFESQADLFYPEDSASAERARMDWLATWAHINNACPNGYDVIDRKPVWRTTAKRSQILYYSVRCK